MPVLGALQDAADRRKNIPRGNQAEVVHIRHERFARRSVRLPNPQRLIRLYIQHNRGNVECCGKVDCRGVGGNKKTQLPNEGGEPVEGGGHWREEHLGERPGNAFSLSVIGRLIEKEEPALRVLRKETSKEFLVIFPSPKPFIIVCSVLVNPLLKMLPIMSYKTNPCVLFQNLMHLP